MADLKLSQLIQRTPAGTEYFEVIIPPFGPGDNRKVLLQDLIDIFGVDHFKGVFGSEAALEAAFPDADPGDYALVDVGAQDATLYIWDDNDTDWIASGVSSIVPDASETTKGILEIATQAETDTGTDDVRAVTPEKLASTTHITGKVDKETFATLTFASPVAWNQNNRQAPLAKLVATGDFTINMTNVKSGAQGVFQVEADTASAFLMTFDSDFTNKDAITGNTLTTYTFPANDNFVYTNTFIVDGTTIWWVIGDYMNALTASPFAKVRRAATQSFSNGDVATPISWDTEDADNASIFSAGSPTLLAVVGSGNKIATVHIYVEWATNSTGIRRAWIYVNGAAVTGLLFQKEASSGAVATVITGTAQFPVVAGDTIEIRPYQNSGGNLNVTAVLTVKYESR